MMEDKLGQLLCSPIFQLPLNFQHACTMAQQFHISVSRETLVLVHKEVRTKMPSEKRKNPRFLSTEDYIKFITVK